MTIDEAIKELKEDIELYIPLHGTIDDVDRELPDGRLITALDMAIKALEQEPIIDKIRAEIVELRSKQNVGVLECLDIIDKYKTDNEVGANE